MFNPDDPKEGKKQVSKRPDLELAHERLAIQDEGQPSEPPEKLATQIPASAKALLDRFRREKEEAERLEKIRETK